MYPTAVRHAACALGCPESIGLVTRAPACAIQISSEVARARKLVLTAAKAAVAGMPANKSSVHQTSVVSASALSEVADESMRGPTGRPDGSGEGATTGRSAIKRSTAIDPPKLRAQRLHSWNKWLTSGPRRKCMHDGVQVQTFSVRSLKVDAISFFTSQADSEDRTEPTELCHARLCLGSCNSSRGAPA